jgi:beta-glucosidase
MFSPPEKLVDEPAFNRQNRSRQYMKNIRHLLALGIIAFVLGQALQAQTNAPAATNWPAVAQVHANTAIIPVSRTGGATNRQSLVLQRARENPGACDIVFIGDSITERWETSGSNVWKSFYGRRKCLNFGVGGDRTEHVLWRFEQGQLDGVKPKVAVVMIGTNNSGDRGGNTESEILEGVTAIIQQIRARLPETKIILLGIFPRAKTFSPQRGRILQVNQALEKLDDGKTIFYMDIGSQLIEPDGSISSGMMRDYLHPGEQGYEIWAQAMEPKLKELLHTNPHWGPGRR